MTGSGPTSSIDHEKLAAAVGNPFRETLFWRLSAERDIRPEAQAAELKIDSNGGGLTSTVAQIINRINHPSHLVEREMLRTLNSIFRARCQIYSDYSSTS